MGPRESWSSWMSPMRGRLLGGGLRSPALLVPTAAQGVRRPPARTRTPTPGTASSPSARRLNGQKRSSPALKRGLRCRGETKATALLGGPVTCRTDSSKLGSDPRGPAAPPTRPSSLPQTPPSRLKERPHGMRTACSSNF